MRSVLVEDERNRGFPAVLKYGSFLFMSGSEGHRDLATEQIVPALDGKAIEQCRNSYGRVARRLEKAGYSGDCCIWIENFTSGQHWRLERMALWPEYFGEVGHAQAVSFGVQTKQPGINMILASVLAITPDVERHVLVKPPGRGRASRATRVGDFVYVIGVRGHAPEGQPHEPEECPEAYDAQLDICFDALTKHIKGAGIGFDSFVRLDGAMRDPDTVDRYYERAAARLGGKVPFGGYGLGTILGGRHDQEVGGIAAAAGVDRQISWSERAPNRAEAVKAGGLVFTSQVSGIQKGFLGPIAPDLVNDFAGQVRQAVDNLEAILVRQASGSDRMLRLDIALRNIYREDQLIALLKQRLGANMPTLIVVGAEPRFGAEIEITAIASAA